MKRVGIVAALALSGACISEYQTARTLPPGKTTVGGAMTNVRSVDHLDEESFDTVDLMIRHGVGPTSELTGRYGHFGGASTLLLGGKVGLMPDRLAVAASAGPFWGDGEYGGLFAVPALVWSVPSGPNAELTGSARLVLVVPDEGDSDAYPGADIGVRLSTDLNAWAFHPSIGLLHVSEGDESETLISFGAALTFTR